MAGIEVEVDTTPQLPFDNKADEDLIDYDDDELETYSQAAPGDTQGDKKGDTLAASGDGDGEGDDGGDTVTELGSFTVHQNIDAQTNVVPPTQKTTPVDHAEDQIETESVHLEPSALEDAHADNVDFFDNDDHVDINDGHPKTTTANSSHEASHEIDYDFDDVPNMEASYDEQSHAAEGAADLTVEGDHADESKSSIDVEGHPLPDVEVVHPATTAEQDEITWEHHGDVETGDDESKRQDDVLEATAADDVGEGGLYNEHDAPDDENENEAGVIQQAETERVETPQEVFAEDFLENVNMDDAVPTAQGDQEGNMASPEATDPTGAANDSTLTEQPDFPAITVQYKGEEFPLFSVDSEGFFSEVSVLDGTIESLLSGFRSELADEVALEDELVFQVDELGLEFTESNQRGSVPTLTLRQILEIFDLLVKNQDPDSFRVLYTYLTIKPNTNKRFEFLAESAAAGKGLEEVMHLFETPVQHNADAVAADGHGEDLDSYESPNDDSDVLDEHFMENSLEGLQDELLVAERQVEDMQQHVEAVGELPEFAEAEPVQIETAAVPATTETTQAHGAGDLDPLVSTNNTNAHKEDEPNAFLQFDMGEGAHLDDVDIVQEDAPLAVGLAETDTALLGATDTNTTGALTNDVETLSAPNDLPEDPIMDHVIEQSEAAADQDLLAEIDWTNEPESVSSVTVAEDQHSGSGKRARTDEEPTTGDEQDAKRRRS